MTGSRMCENSAMSWLTTGAASSSKGRRVPKACGAEASMAVIENYGFANSVMFRFCASCDGCHGVSRRQLLGRSDVSHWWCWRTVFDQWYWCRTDHCRSGAAHSITRAGATRDIVGAGTQFSTVAGAVVVAGGAGKCSRNWFCGQSRHCCNRGSGLRFAARPNRHGLCLSGQYCARQ